MNSIILDECLQELMLAEECASHYVEIDSYYEIFEASNPELQNQVKNNQSVVAKTESHLKKAIQAIIDMIHKLISNIKNFFTKGRINDREKQMKASYEASKRKDPSIKNKKISCLDVNKFKKQSDDLTNEAESLYRQLDAGNNVDTTNIINRISNFCSSGASAVTVSIGMEAALQAASSSKEMAREISNYLEQNIDIQERLMNSVGKKEYQKFKKDVDCMGKKISLRRKILELHGYTAKSFEDAIQKTYSECENVFSGLGTLVGVVMSNPENNKDGSKSKVGIALSTGKHILKNYDEVKPALKDVKDNHGIKMIKRIAGNEDISNVGKLATDMANRNTDIKHQMYVNNKKASKKAIKKHNKLLNSKSKSNQSMMDSMMGNYDDNSNVRDNKLANMAIDLARKLR